MVKQDNMTFNIFLTGLLAGILLFCMRITFLFLLASPQITIWDLGGVPTWMIELLASNVVIGFVLALVYSVYQRGLKKKKLSTGLFFGLSMGLLIAVATNFNAAASANLSPIGLDFAAIDMINQIIQDLIVYTITGVIISWIYKKL
ncbi:MAG: hypothetical protein GOU97_04110 [Nanoarchaeota archaeon]|nr:hypothetical protein [Nanoarchaeota archaeon]